LPARPAKASREAHWARSQTTTIQRGARPVGIAGGPVPPFNNVQSWYVWVLHDADYRPFGGRSGAVGAGFDERAMNRLKRP